MLYYIASAAYQQVIMESCREAEQIIVNGECKEDLYVLPLIRENYQMVSSLDCFLLDLAGIKDSDQDVVAALDQLKIANGNIKIVVLAAHRKAGDKLLAEITGYTNNIVTTPDFLEMKKEIMHCILQGKEYKDVVIYKDVAADAADLKIEVKKVDHVTIGVAGSQHRIGCTHHSIIIANFLRKQGYMTALVEYSKAAAFGQIADSYQIALYGDYFTKDGNDYYLRPSPAVQERAYNFVIFDFGDIHDLQEEEFEKYKACDRKIFISGIKAWEENQIQDFFGKFKDIEELGAIHYFFNFCSEGFRQMVKSGMAELRDTTYFLGYTDDPFNYRNMPCLDEILSDYFPKEITAPTKKRKNK